MEMIHYRDMLKEMDSCDAGDGDQRFFILFLTCNRDKKDGGRWRRYDRAQKCGLRYSCKDHEMRGIVDYDSGKKTAVHLRLVFEFNGKKVFW